MGSESKNFLGLCKLLSSSYGEPALEQFRPGIPSDRWGEILALANRHRVSPAMRQALKSGYATAAVPDAIARSLENVYRLNERRNMLIVRQFTEAAALLNRSGIFPAPLKTLVNMLESPADELGKWTTRDIDLLVTRSDFLKAGKLLEEYGYAPKKTFNDLMHSYPNLYRTGELVGVDLHRDLGPQRILVTAEEALRDAKQIEHQGCVVKILTPTHRMLHLLYHDEIQDRRFELGRISLHQLLNFAYLVTHYDREIDWVEVERRLRAARYKHLLSSYCLMAERLLGIRSENFPKAGWRPKLHFHRCIAQMSNPTLQALITTWETMTPPAVSKKDIEYMAGHTSWTYRLRHRLAFVQDVWQRHGMRIFRKIELLRRMRVQRR